jgi:hypothetical protein
VQGNSLRCPQNPPVLSTLGVQLPLPAPSTKVALDKGFKQIGSFRDELIRSSPKMSCDAAVTGKGRTRSKGLQSRPGENRCQGKSGDSYRGRENPDTPGAGTMRVSARRRGAGRAGSRS